MEINSDVRVMSPSLASATLWRPAISTPKTNLKIAYVEPFLFSLLENFFCIYANGSTQLVSPRNLYLRQRRPATFPVLRQRFLYLR